MSGAANPGRVSFIASSGSPSPTGAMVSQAARRRRASDAFTTLSNADTISIRDPLAVGSPTADRQDMIGEHIRRTVRARGSGWPDPRTRHSRPVRTISVEDAKLKVYDTLHKEADVDE